MKELLCVDRKSQVDGFTLHSQLLQYQYQNLYIINDELIRDTR